MRQFLPFVAAVLLSANPHLIAADGPALYKDVSAFQLSRLHALATGQKVYVSINIPQTAKITIPKPNEELAKDEWAWVRRVLAERYQIEVKPFGNEGWLLGPAKRDALPERNPARGSDSSQKFTFHLDQTEVLDVAVLYGSLVGRYTYLDPELSGRMTLVSTDDNWEAGTKRLREMLETKHGVEIINVGADEMVVRMKGKPVDAAPAASNPARQRIRVRAINQR